MSGKDYKPRQSARDGRGSRLLLGMFIGFILGLITASVIAVYMLKAPVPFLDKPKVPEKTTGGAQVLKDTPPVANKDDGKPRFDFYRILPGQEEPVTNEQLKQAAVKDKSSKSEPELKDTYFLQAGAFQNPADADNMKARLALLGFEANVEPANIADKGVMYRVRLGPYNKIDDINKVRTQLAQNSIEPSLIRIRDAKDDKK